MSEIPAERFENSASASLEASVFSVLEDYDIYPFGEHWFSTEGQSVVWMRFKDGELTDLTADVSRLDEPFKTIINLSYSPDGFIAVEANIPNDAYEITDRDEFASQTRVKRPALLDFTQQSRLTDILDEIESLIGEDYFDTELEQFLDQSIEEDPNIEPSLWSRKFKSAKFFGKTALIMLGSYSPYYIFIPPPIR